MKRVVFVTGGSAYIGTRFIARLLENGHSVRALVRPGSEKKIPPGCPPVFGNALDASTFSHLIKPADTFVHLVGVAHAGPAKAAEFKAIDLASIQASVPVAKKAGIEHFIYTQCRATRSRDEGLC